MPDENKSYAFITGIYTVTTQRMKKLYTTHPLAMEATQYKQ